MLEKKRAPFRRAHPHSIDSKLLVKENSVNLLKKYRAPRHNRNTRGPACWNAMSPVLLKLPYLSQQEYLLPLLALVLDSIVD